MLKIVQGFSFILLALTVFGAQASASSSEEAMAPLAKDICWRPDIKQSLKKNIGIIIDGLNASLRGHVYSVDDVISSPRIITLQDFGLVSIDADAGRLTCDAMLKVVYKSRKYGAIVVPLQKVNFKIGEAESGQEAAVTLHDLGGYIELFGDKMRGIYAGKADDEDTGN